MTLRGPLRLLSVLSDSSSVGGRERSLRIFRVRGCCIPTAHASLRGLGSQASRSAPSSSAQFFGLEVPRWFMDEIGLAGQLQVVGQAELLPILLARYTWRTNLRNAALISFVDNDAARHAVVSGSSPSLASSRIISELACMDSKLNILSWTARVPSASNIADGPSRLVFCQVRAMGATSLQVQGATGSPLVWEEVAQ